MKISIILATVNRPHLLRAALSSVAAQTRLDHIKEIIVSENGGSRESQSICAQFPNLPIVYRFRESVLPPFEHWRQLFREAIGGDYVAILHDDDEWLPGHLATGLDALEKHPDAALYGGRYVETRANFGFTDYSLCPASVHWVFSGQPKSNQVIAWNTETVMALCALGTPVHYSSMIWRKPAFIKAAAALTRELQFDTDRTLIAEAALAGSVLYNPVAHVVIRLHAEQHQNTAGSSFAAEQTLQTTKLLIQMAERQGLNLIETVNRRLAECPLELKKRLIKELAGLNLRVLGLLDKDRVLEPYYQQYARQRRKKSIQRWVPPAFLAWIMGILKQCRVS